MKLIIFLTLTYGNKRDSKRLGFEHLKKNNFIIEQCNLGPWLLPNYASNYVPFDKINNFSKDINNSKQFLEYVEKITLNTFVFDPWNCYGFSQVEDILSKKKFIYCSMITNNHLTYDTISRIKLKIFSTFTLDQKKFKITNYNKSNKLRHLDYFLYAGKKSIKNSKFVIGQNTKKIKVNSHDYDNYLESVNINKSLYNFKYSIFIDEAFPNHPDLLLFKNKKQCDPDIYYKELNNFFNKYEQITKNKIIIAGHPRIYYDKSYRNYFSNREIVIGKTNLLIKFSQDVIVHTSQAHCYAIIYNKRIIWIDSNNYNRNTRLLIQSRSRYLNSSIINISKYNLKFNIKPISKIKYKKYYNEYIREDQSIPNKSVWEIFTDNINNEKEF